jgi:Bacterial Ig-like domain
MKRRSLLAVLCVLVLVIVAVVLIGGNDRHEAEATKGKPWTGSSGVTRNVASIAGRQRFVDRHPSVLPSADEIAAAEGVKPGEGEEEGEAARENPTGEAQPGEGEEQAQPEGEGEPARAGAETVGGQRVKEKPEPGEESLPPKVAGPAPPLQRSGRSAIGPRSSLSSGTSFLGADFGDSGFVPPDSMGAVGPTQVLVDVNGRLRVFDKSGNQNPGDLDVSDSTFWTSQLPSGVEPTDPGVEYDRLSGRWIVSAISVQNNNNLVMLAVSDSSTITDETSFTFFSFPEFSPTGQLADYPQLGVDANAIYIGVNRFGSLSGSFTGTSLYVIQKSSVIGAGPIHVTGFQTVSSPASLGPDSPQPATNMDPGADTGYVVGPDNLVLNRMDVVKVIDPGTTTPTISTSSMSLPSTAQPLSVPAQGAVGGIDALDDRFFEAMVGRGPGGSDTLWTAHNIRVNSSGVGAAGGDRDATRWYQVGNLGSTPSLIQSGTLFDTAASNPRFFWMPSIAMNGQGHASLNTSTAGVGRFAEIASSGRLATDPSGTTEPFQLTQSSSSSYNLGSGSPRRWGDFSQTVVDPTDDQTFWTFQEYASAQNVWGVRVIQLKAPPPATPAAASPNTILPGQPSVPVTITGTSTDGSGFFDPGPDTGGPGFPNRITASVGGGVVVNSVTYTDPTHITLDLDTTAAANGAQSVTVTNPDGQSSSCTPLVVGTDTDAPSAPNPQGTTPSSPGNDNNPKVFGSNAECGSTVKVYTNSTCSSASATGSAVAFASPGIPVTVADNSSTSFWARATDVSNNTSACSATSTTYVEDSTPPHVSVDSGPTGSTTEKTPTFTFSGSDAVGPITFKCSIDTGTANFSACSGPGNSDTASSPLPDGSYTFRVQATDRAANSAVATRSFAVQTPTSPPPTAPDTTITKGPKKKTHKRKPKFQFTSSQAGSTFQCRLDRGAFKPCTAPFVPSVKLKPGKHVLKVQAIGPTGIADGTPAVRKFKVLG